MSMKVILIMRYLEQHFYGSTRYFRLDLELKIICFNHNKFLSVSIIRYNNNITSILETDNYY